MRSFLRTHWKVVVPVGLLAGAVLAWLAFAFFGVHTLFFDDTVDEDGPVFASGAGAAGPDADSATADPASPTDDAALDADADAGPDESAEDGAPSDGSGDGQPDAVDGGAEPEADPEPADEAPPEIITLVEGSFVGRSHPAEGVALVLNDGSEQRFLRFEDFATDNGPDLNVYLSTAPADAPEGDFDDEFVDLGTLKGNIGSQNYEIPPDVDLDRFSTVVIWCVRFGVAFGAADLA